MTSDDPQTPRTGDHRINDSGERQVYVFGSWWTGAEAEQAAVNEQRGGLFRRQPVPQKRAKLISKDALGPAGELNSEQQDWAERSRNRIRRAGHRRGGARELLIELFAREDCALTVQEIDKRLTAWQQGGVVGRPVGIASVYRGVEVLQDLRLIARVDVGDGVARYERAPLEQSDHHHHHFVCDRCGLLLPFDDDALERAIAALETRFGFEVAEHEVVLKGRCEGCR